LEKAPKDMGIEIDENGLPWQSGGIWVGLGPETVSGASAAEPEYSDHEQHLRDMAVLERWLRDHPLENPLRAV
jgi:hypothetical protein